MKFRVITLLSALVFFNFDATAANPSENIGFKATKIFTEAGDCLFYPRSADDLATCPAKGSDSSVLDSVEVTGARIPDEVLSPIVDAGLKTLSGLLIAAGSDSSYSRVQGLSIDIKDSPRCLLLVHGEFVSRESGKSLTSHLIDANPGLNQEQEDRCELKGKIFPTACARTKGAENCKEIDPKDTSLYNRQLTDEIWFASRPALVLELKLDMSYPGFIRFSPTYIQYSQTLKSGRNGSRDLLLLAIADSKSSTAPYTEVDGKASADNAQVLFDWRDTKTGALYRGQQSEPWSPLIPYSTTAATDSEEGLFSLWFAIVETKRGSAFLKNLGESFDKSENQQAIKDAAMAAFGTKPEDKAAADEMAASGAMKALAAKKAALLSSAQPYCAAEQKTEQLMLAIEVEYYDYQDAYTAASRAMRTAGRRIDNGAFPKPDDTMDDSWVEEYLCT